MLFSASVQILTKTRRRSAGFGDRSFATEVKNQISSLSQSAANIGWKISQCLLDCTGNTRVSIYSLMT